jgi:hypothetical protein
MMKPNANHIMRTVCLLLAGWDVAVRKVSGWGVFFAVLFLSSLAGWLFGLSPLAPMGSEWEYPPLLFGMLGIFAALLLGAVLARAWVIVQDELPIDVPIHVSREKEGGHVCDAPLHDLLRDASYCPTTWDEMAGDDLVRVCPRCQKNVFNLSRMSGREAVAFIQETEGQHCVRFCRRRDNTLLTEDCPQGRQAEQKACLWIGTLICLVIWLLGRLGGIW